MIVTSEVFNLWVIEGKKEWSDILPIHKNSKSNVLWTDDVTPYKKRKVRILNGGHTSTVLAAYLAGHKMCIRDSVDTIKEYTMKIAKEMNVRGLMNMQYAIEDDVVYVLEANPRASRTVPLVSKVCNINMVQLATQIVTSELTKKPSPVPELKERTFSHYGVKEAVFPFNMFQEVDPVLGPEMRSTGEVLGIAKDFGEAFYKAEEATGVKLPTEGTVLMSISSRDKAVSYTHLDVYKIQGYSLSINHRFWSHCNRTGL